MINSKYYVKLKIENANINWYIIIKERRSYILWNVKKKIKIENTHSAWIQQSSNFTSYKYYLNNKIILVIIII